MHRGSSTCGSSTLDFGCDTITASPDHEGSQQRGAVSRGCMHLTMRGDDQRGAMFGEVQR
jgi:hypothetical protein